MKEEGKMLCDACGTEISSDTNRYDITVNTKDGESHSLVCFCSKECALDAGAVVKRLLKKISEQIV